MEKTERAVREASHAGSWYEGEPQVLSKELDKWLSEGGQALPSTHRAIIAPHAGYRYSGPTAAWAYKHLQPPTTCKRVFLLGPSHHYGLDNCALSKMTEYETPLGNIPLDLETIADLTSKSSTLFGERMSKRVDEEEHSLEMHLPYIVKSRQNQEPFKLVPILVGSPSLEEQDEYGKILAPYLDNPENFFVISSDFCHWGKRFSYTYTDKEGGPIWKSIERLDRMGMDLIEKQDPVEFNKYIKQYRNTICGRTPISILLFTIKHSKNKHNLKFVHYAQSSQCVSPSDSSVSYASGVLSVAK